MRAFLKKHHTLVLYAACGVPTVAANLVVYFVMVSFDIMTAISCIVAVLASILVAYFTNKIWVFHIKRNRKRDVFKEFIAFLSFRLLSGTFEVVAMVVFVDLLHMGKYEACIKFAATGIVIIINYIAAKKIVFRDKK